MPLFVAHLLNADSGQLLLDPIPAKRGEHLLDPVPAKRVQHLLDPIPANRLGQISGKESSVGIFEEKGANNFF